MTRHVWRAFPIPQLRTPYAIGYGHRGDLGKHQTKQKAPGFKSPYTRLESVDGFQKLDTVAMQTKKGTVVGCINSFDKTPAGRPQKLRIKTDWTNGDGRVGRNTTQLRKIQKRDGYAYQIVPSVKSVPHHMDTATQLFLPI